MSLVKAPLRWFGNLSLPIKVLLPTLLVLASTSLWIISYASTATRQNTIDGSISSARHTIEQYKTLRAYYTKNVVAKVKQNSAAEVSYDHQTNPKAIPLPVTQQLVGRFKYEAADDATPQTIRPARTTDRPKADRTLYTSA